MSRRRVTLMTAAALAGVTFGWVLMQYGLRRHREDLFHPRPIRRLAALAYLEGQATVDTLRVLQDYLTWERHPLLRRKALSVSRHLRARLR
jgi:hypothetical protein